MTRNLGQNPAKVLEALAQAKLLLAVYSKDQTVTLSPDLNWAEFDGGVTSVSAHIANQLIRNELIYLDKDNEYKPTSSYYRE